MSENNFEVISLGKNFYMKPDEYVSVWAKKCGWKATLAYDSLWRHADRSMETFPSYKLMAEEHGVSESTIKRGVSILEQFNIISKEQKQSSKGKFLHNTYLLLNVQYWKSPVGLQGPTDNRRSVEDPTVGLVGPHKDIHNKGEHITKVIYKPLVYGKPEINILISFLKEKMEIPQLDGTEQNNRRFANTLLKQSRTGVDGVKWLIEQASKDPWFKNHITSFRDVWNNKVKIITSTRKEDKKDETKRAVYR